MDSNLPQLPISSETGDALAKPIAESVGNAGKDILEAVFHVALDGIRRFNMQRQFKLDKFQKELEEGTSSIPLENRDDSKLGLVLKAIEDSKYQLDEDDIRELFTKLITSTLDNRKSDKVLPIFSTIISNMTPSEANLLKSLYLNTLSLTPYVELKISTKNTGIARYPGHAILLLDSSNTYGAELDLSLLESANLIKHDTGSSLNAPRFIQRYETGERLLSQIVEQNHDHPVLALQENEIVDFDRSIYELTPIGKSFCEVIFE
jgi:hypothetical protein|nr:MAG TPA: protein of unknown function (DUF4393) [Caudoviricetes sp.]